MSVLEQYIKELNKNLSTGHAGELAHRPAFRKLIKAINSNIDIISEPIKIKGGKPDFLLQRKKITIGCIETKDICINLDNKQNVEQVNRYVKNFDNFLLTNYIEFRFFKNGKRYKTIKIGELLNDRIEEGRDTFNLLHEELDFFTKTGIKKIINSQDLAKSMGRLARRINDDAVHVFNNVISKTKSYSRNQGRKNDLRSIYYLLKEKLIKDLPEKDFIDMYAQTLVYGLFVARYYSDENLNDFTREKARNLISMYEGNDILTHFFDHITGADFDSSLNCTVNELCEVLRMSDVRRMMNSDSSKTNFNDKADPIVYFYEDFLQEYNSGLRKVKGAYYTPLSVVKFIIRQIDIVLKQEFQVENGLANDSKVDFDGDASLHKIQILDPAVGTGTFINELIIYVFEEYFKNQRARWNTYVKDNFIPRLHGFEVMMAPYIIAHLKLNMTLKQIGYSDFNNVAGIYLTNTLEKNTQPVQSKLSLGLEKAIEEEYELVSNIKNNIPVMIVVGNPPYQKHSVNKSSSINTLIDKYKIEPCGGPLQEKNKTALQDDYIKFIAFAENIVQKNKHGIIAMITNNGYLDNITCRGMRWCLRNTFDKIFILNLHGSSKKNERTISGEKDENIFDITIGTSIIIAIKVHQKSNKNLLAKIHYADLEGLKEYKFDFLDNNNIDIINWQILKDHLKRYCLFVPVRLSDKKISEYESYISVKDLFMYGNTGITTGNDSATIAFSKKELEESEGLKKWINDFANEEYIDRNKLKQIDYRPFDKRWTYYDKNSNGFLNRPRHDLMKNYLDKSKKNLGMIILRQNKTKAGFNAFVHKNIVESSYISNKTGGGAYSFPLYQILGNTLSVSNFNEKKLKSFMNRICIEYSSRDVFNYIYAVLWSPDYHNQYAEIIKIDFPKIPPPLSNQRFKLLSDIGCKLVKLHLGNYEFKNSGDIVCNTIGNNIVDKKKIRYEDNKVYFNEKQCFENIAARNNISFKTWNFVIGAYKPTQKWLQDRDQKELSDEDMKQYQNILLTIGETNKILEQLELIKYD